METRGDRPVAEETADSRDGAEWWERLAGRWRQRAAASRWAPALRRVLTVGAWVGVAYLLVVLLLWPSASWGVRVWFGVAWVLLVWTLMARTRTLAATSVFRIFSFCIPWSAAVGVASWWVTTTVAGLDGPNADGGSVVVASVAEEVLKLLPLAVLALAAPGRVRRFAVADWALVGFASGAAFELVEESLRRIYLMTAKGGLLDFCHYREGYERLRCYDVPVMGLNPFGSASAGDPPYAGHAVMTALVAVGVGLAVRVVRARLVARPGAALWSLLPVVLLVVAMVDHAARNAGLSSGDWGPHADAVPLGVRLFHTLTGGGHGREALLLVLLVVGMVLDASAYRLGLMADVAPGAPAGGLDRTYARLRARVSGWSAPSHATWAVASVLDLGYLLARDLRDDVVVLVSRSEGDEPAGGRVAAARAARELQHLWLRQRLAREEVMRGLFDEPPTGRARFRWPALAAAVVGLLVVLTVAPVLARTFDEATSGSGFFWLAGVLEGVSEWWDGLPPVGKAGVILAVAALALAVPGVGLGAAIGIGGTAWNLAEHSDDLADFVRDPRAAAGRYLRDRGPAGVVVDTALFLLPWGVGRFGSALRSPAAHRLGSAVVEAHEEGYRWWRLAPPPGGAAYSGLPPPHSDWLVRVLEGTRWHRAQQTRLDGIRGGVSELYVHKPEGTRSTVTDLLGLRYNRVDHHNRRLLEILSMKHTQLAKVKHQTAVRYLDELATKYKPGTRIADVPSTPRSLVGEELDGQMILLVPPQRAPIPAAVLEHARTMKIAIIDPSGHRYT